MNNAPSLGSILGAILTELCELFLSLVRQWTAWREEVLMRNVECFLNEVSMQSPGITERLSDQRTALVPSSVGCRAEFESWRWSSVRGCPSAAAK